MIAHHYFDKYGGLNFLLQCNYDTHYLNEIPKFYNEMLEYYNEITLTDGSQNIIWNNRNIKNQQQTRLLKNLAHSGHYVYFGLEA